MSFLLHEKIIVSEAPQYAKISGYGLGYFLWISSIAILSTGQYIKSHEKNYQIKIFKPTSIILISALGAFSLHYFYSSNSHYKLISLRDHTFKEMCKTSKTTINKTASNVKSIYFNNNWGASYKLGDNGMWLNNGVGVLANDISAGLIDFYEVDNKNNSKDKRIANPYIQFLSRRSGGTGIDSPQSDYAVLTTNLELPRELNIQAASIKITNLKTGFILASTNYAFNESSRQFCGHSENGNFSSMNFIRKVLGAYQ